jgi:hypothetical protein
MLVWGDNSAYAPVVSAKRVDNRIELNVNRPYETYSRAAGVNVGQPIRLAEVKALYGGGAIGGFFAASETTSDQPIIAQRGDVGADPDWLVLHAAAEVPDTRQ